MSSASVIVFGAAYSVYVRIVRLALAEKGVPYELHEVDIFAEGGPPPDYLERHPFGRIPAFEHDGFRLYETAAITRYVDEAFDGPALQPDSLCDRARMNQAIGILDSYAYRTLVWDISVERKRDPAEGRGPDEAKITAALPRAEICLNALAHLKGGASWLAGDNLSLADLHAAPILAFFTTTPEGQALMAGVPALGSWWDALSSRKTLRGLIFAD